MGVLLDNGKYQVLENLLSTDGYAACVCIDIETRNDYKPLIINTYSDPAYIREYLPLLADITSEKCDDFHRVVTGSSLVMAVFNYHGHMPFGDYIKSLPVRDFETRAAAAGNFLDAFLAAALLPPVFLVSALEPANTVYDKAASSVFFNFVLRPREVPADGEVRELLLSVLESVFVENRYLPETVSAFLGQIRNGSLSGFADICSKWRKISDAAMEEYEAYKAESYFKYLRRRAKRKSKMLSAVSGMAER